MRVRQNFWRLLRGMFVILFFVFSLETLAEGPSPRKPSDPPPSDASELPPGQQPCLVRNGITICDPELINIIIRYNLEVLPAPPPGIQPLVVESLAELESILAALIGLATPEAGEVGEPIIRPYDPETMRMGRPARGDPGGGGGGGSGRRSPPPTPPDTDPTNPSPPNNPSPPASRVERVITFPEPTISAFALLAGYTISLTVVAAYYPGERFTQVAANYRVDSFGIIWHIDIEEHPILIFLLDNGKTLYVMGRVTITVSFLFKGFPIQASRTFDLVVQAVVPTD